MSQAPLCPVHSLPMRPGKPGSGFEHVFSCSEFLGQGEPGANKNGYCNQKADAQGRPALPAGRRSGPSPAPRPAAAPQPSNLRVIALEAAVRIYQGTGKGEATLMLAEQFQGWLTDDGAGER